MEARWAHLLQEITANARETAVYTGRPVLSERVMTAMARVPRVVFVPDSIRVDAYVNKPLLIGYGQTISQPFIVALMTDLLDLTPTDKVLEIGSGSGYQSAILAELVSEVHSVELVADLAHSAARRLAKLGYSTVHIHHGQGRYGWPEAAPYAAILVAAASPDIPPHLVEQLEVNGRMVIPVKGCHNNSGIHQKLLRLVKQPDNTLKQQRCLSVAFVPLIGQD
ncbi:Protein-L-isoaspartate O-methyltransferase [invertebrate metagenome]|uniref:protein-L-isoaspartate(D-aspartate) O-methyltransferase n=1 Tax=invertebrate metagenome TaxID=1711999 RepID=A0A484H4P9_9ZZZZ